MQIARMIITRDKIIARIEMLKAIELALQETERQLRLLRSNIGRV